MSSKIYCIKCRDINVNNIARQKLSNEVFSDVEVISQLSPVLYKCRCRKCRHIWKSKSPEAAKLYLSRQGEKGSG
jgi:hypothetical protein